MTSGLDTSASIFSIRWLYITLDVSRTGVVMGYGHRLLLLTSKVTLQLLTQKAASTEFSESKAACQANSIHLATQTPHFSTGAKRLKIDFR